MTTPLVSIPPQVAGLNAQRQWPVDIFRGSDGAESRAALLDESQGLRTISFNAKSVKSSDQERILATIQSATSGLVYCPFWPLSTRLSAATTGGAVAVDQVPYDVKAGSTVAVLAPDGRKSTIHTVSSVSGSDVTLDPAPVAAEYPAGAWLVPAIRGFADAPRRAHQFDWSPTMEISIAELDPDSEPGGSLPVTYLGHWVFGQGEGWEDILPRASVSIQGGVRPAMVGMAHQKRTRTIEEPLEFSIDINMLLHSPDETSLIWRMQDALGGQLTGLWVRSYIADASPLSIDGAVVSVVDRGQRAIFEGRHLWDRKNNTGHHVVSVADGDTGEIDITLDPAPAADAGPLELLFFCRLAADTIGMQANTDNVQRWDCSITLRELPSETPEPEE